MGTFAERLFGNRKSVPERSEFLDEDALVLRKNIERAARQLPSRRDRLCVEDALNLTQRAYVREEPRKDGAMPINHIYRVTNTVAVDYGIKKDGDMIVAALLHDLPEDRPEMLARLGDRSGNNDHVESILYIANTYGRRVGEAVMSMTKPPLEKGLSEHDRQHAYIEYVRTLIKNPLALVVKTADICDNVFNASPDFDQTRYSMKKYAPAISLLIGEVERRAQDLDKVWGKGLSEKILKNLTDAQGVAGFFNHAIRLSDRSSS